MRTDLTDITLIVDTSGSMWKTKDDAEGGINKFIEEQKTAAGEAKLTLIEFSSICRTIYQGVDIQSVERYQMNPRGNTALLDAVGHAIDAAGARFAAMDESDRPGLVVFVIVTDGQENASREYTREAIKSRITHQQDKYNWRFIYLGSDLNTYNDAGALGIRLGTTARYASHNTVQAYNSASANLCRSRETLTSGGTVSSAALDFNDAQMQSMN